MPVTARRVSHAQLVAEAIVSAYIREIARPTGPAETHEHSSARPGAVVHLPLDGADSMRSGLEVAEAA